MRKPPLDYSSLVRLEVETTPSGLPNLVPNPSGEKGAWFWLTPDPAQVITTVTGGLKFTTNVGAATAYFYTELMPVAAGKWVQGAVNITGYKATTTGQLGGSLSFYDADGNPLGNTSTYGYGTTRGSVKGGLGIVYTGAAQAPAGTAFVSVRWELLRDDAYPPTGDWVTFNQAMVATASALSTLAARRTNLMLNGGFPTTYVGTVGWTINSPHTLSWDGTWHVANNAAGAKSAGAGSAKVVSGGSATEIQATTATGTAGMRVTAGLPYSLQAVMRASAAGRTVALVILWYDAAGALLSSNVVATTTSVTGTGGIGPSGTATAPTGAVYAAVRVRVTAAPTGEIHWFDAVLFEQSATAGGYFDGDTYGDVLTSAGTPTGARVWDGDTYPSGATSHEDSSSWAYTEPVTWRNILGTSHEIQIDRHSLDVGTLSAVIYDATLDPATAEDVRPGRQVRVQAWTGAAWESVYEGRISVGKASYLRRDDQSTAERVRVELTAEDNTATLANQREPRGVGTLADLPWILEGHGVPWNVTGPGGNQVRTGTQVSSNDSASVLDQVALVRDTVNAQAFVDRTNVLVVRTAPTVATYGWTDDPAIYATGRWSYTDIEIDFSTDNLINEVSVVWLRYNSTTGETTEVTYGPYRRLGSIRQWGVRSATYTLQGTTESPTTIANYAKAVLDANSQPVARPRRLVAAVKRTGDVSLATRYDLGTQAPVVRAGRLNASYNITGISHTITPELWEVAYEFEPPGSVASPTFTPPPPSDPVVTGVINATTVVTPNTGWSVTAGQFYRQGRVVHARVTFQRTGANVALGTPEYADQLMGTINDAAWRPVQAVSSASYNGFRSVHILAAGTIYTSSGLADGIYTGSGINTGDNIAVGVTYLLPEGV